MIDTIQNDLLKSAELTGSWEKQLKDIEKGAYSASAFIRNMKRMVDALVYEVRSETKRANISHAKTIAEQRGKVKVKPKKAAQAITAEACPKCKQGHIIKGKTAYGCSAYKTGCNFVMPFKYGDKKISEKQFIRLLQKGSTVNLKGFKTEAGPVEGLLRLDADFKLKFEPMVAPKPTAATHTNDSLLCPKCKTGTVLKGKTAYGCSAYTSGCDFKVDFEVVRTKMNGQTPTKALVHRILNEST